MVVSAKDWRAISVQLGLCWLVAVVLGLQIVFVVVSAKDWRASSTFDFDSAAGSGGQCINICVFPCVSILRWR